MPSLTLAAFCILLKLADITANICSYFFHVSGSLPQVPTLFGGYDNGLLYALNPCGFLSKCQQRYGPVYRVSLGSWRLIIVSSGDAISSVFTASSQLLRNDVMHPEMAYVVAGVKANYTHLHGVMIRELYPLVDRCLSPRSLGQTTQGPKSQAFGLVLLSQIKNFIQDHTGPISLIQLTGEPLYNATNLVLLGSAFPADTYRDFQTLNKSIPYRFTRTLLWFWPSYAARMRLLKSLRDYLQRGQVIDCNDRFSSGFMQAFKDNNIQSWEGAQLVLNFLWGVHSNTMNNAFFALSFLRGNPAGLARVRTEIDSAVQRFGSLEALLQADPEELDDPAFKFLTSAIMETMRLTGLHAGVRRATCDFELRVRDGTTIPIKKGEFLFGNVHAAHMDATVFPNPEAFVMDRFAQEPYRRKHLQTDGYLFHALGGGRHICKGRWLAIYEIKALLIILLYMFDFSPAVENSASCIGVVHTEDNIFVRLSLRQVEDRL
ncbi:cytochrome P450 [Imleria badia]|nr:cytochrome P450 [Imleria badia]